MPLFHGMEFYCSHAHSRATDRAPHAADGHYRVWDSPLLHCFRFFDKRKARRIHFRRADSFLIPYAMTIYLSPEKKPLIQPV